jgi:hypothetical protein
MAVQAKASNGPATGMPKTPAPDSISSVRSPTGQGYAMNGPHDNASSVAPGKRVLSPLAANLESSVDDDGALAHVIAKGTAMPSPDWQTRAIDTDQKIPSAHGMKSRQVSDGSPGGTIPASIGATSAPVVRKPTA